MPLVDVSFWSKEWRAGEGLLLGMGVVGWGKGGSHVCEVGGREYVVVFCFLFEIWLGCDPEPAHPRPMHAPHLFFARYLCVAWDRGGGRWGCVRVFVCGGLAFRLATWFLIFPTFRFFDVFLHVPSRTSTSLRHDRTCVQTQRLLFHASSARFRSAGSLCGRGID